MTGSRRQELLVDPKLMYALTQSPDGQMYLEVLAGGFAMENLVLPLCSEEVEDYQRLGKSALDELALRLVKQRPRFESRLID
jgi:hypothetical protein